MNNISINNRKIYNVNSISLEIPGLKRIPLKNNLISDFIFFLFLVALPSSFFALIPMEFFFDYRLAYWLVGMVYGIIYLKNIRKILRLPGGKLIFLVIIFLIFRLIYSLVIDQIPIVEIITIFRTNFFYPISFFGFLLYAIEMDNARINRLLHWILIATFIQGCLYLFSNFLNVKIFSVITGKDPFQNPFAIPRYNAVLFVFGLLAVISYKKFKYNFLWIIPLSVTIVGFIRNQIIVFIIIAFLFLLLINLYFKKPSIAKSFKILVSIIAIYIILNGLFPLQLSLLSEKFNSGEGVKSQVANYFEEGTYYFRLNLIKDSYVRTLNNGNILIGNGYIREGIKGGYDFVIGGDTLVAPVIYTEGTIGLIIRILPLLYLIIWGIKNLRKSNGFINYAVIIIILIVPEIINFVQTVIFVRYDLMIFISYLLIIYYKNENRYLLKSLKNKYERDKITQNIYRNSII